MTSRLKNHILPAVLIILSIATIIAVSAWDLTGSNDTVPDDYLYTDPPAGKEMENVSRQIVEIPTPGSKDISSGPNDTIYVGGKDTIDIYDRTGARTGSIAIQGQVQTLTVSPDRTIYAVTKDQIFVIDPGGQIMTRWPISGSDKTVTDIATDEKSVFVAYPFRRIIERLDLEGKLINTIGEKQQGNFGGFVVPSPFFALFIGKDKMVHITNPGKHRIEVFTPEGKWVSELCWGSFSTLSPRGFTGCCNPTHITFMPDGKCITSEKGIPRVKIYGDCELDGIIAGPERFAEGTQGLATACLSDGTVCILEPAGRKLHFVKVDEE